MSKFSKKKRSDTDVMSEVEEDLFDDDLDSVSSGSNKDFGDDDFGAYGSFGDSGKKYDRDSLNLMLNPEKLLHRFRLQLMNAYEVEERVKDDNGIFIMVKKIKFRKNTRPTCNKQGVAEIINYLEKFINNHVVLGNISNEDSFNDLMRSISLDIVGYFISKRRDWEMSLSDIDGLISSSVNVVHLFITRLLFDKQRIHIGEGFKEFTHNNPSNERDKGFFEKVAGFFSGSKKDNRGF